MTWSAPSERIKSSLPVLSTPVTSAPYNLASWIANVPAPPPAPLIITFLPRLDLPFIANPLQGDHCRLRDGRCLLESHTGWFERQGTFTSTHMLGKATQAWQDVSEDFISWLKSPDVSASQFNSSGYVRSEYLITWS